MSWQILPDQHVGLSGLGMHELWPYISTMRKVAPYPVAAEGDLLREALLREVAHRVVVCVGQEALQTVVSARRTPATEQQSRS